MAAIRRSGTQGDKGWAKCHIAIPWLGFVSKWDMQFRSDRTKL